MKKADITTVKKMLSASSEIVIVPHKSPDGDAMGSCLALWWYLIKNGHKATVIAPNDYPKFLKWMPGNEMVLNFEKQHQQAVSYLESADLIFTLDFNHLGRSGQLEPFLEASGASFIMIDHHRSPDDYASVTYSDAHMSSTCEMVYNFIEYLGGGDSIDAAIANCLYTGIMTDTGSFRFASTTAKTHKVAAKLIEKGADHVVAYQNVFDTNSPNRLQLLGNALDNLVVLPEYATAYITLSQAELNAHQYQKGDTEGFVNYGLTVEDITFAAIFIENEEEGIIKISLRSVGNFSVNEFSKEHFNGGGHLNAAGGRSELSLPETVQKFRNLLPKYQKQLLA